VEDDGGCDLNKGLSHDYISLFIITFGVLAEREDAPGIKI